MLWVYLKIVLSLSIPFATLAYARQVRLESEMEAIERDVRQPPNLQWVIAHPREALQKNRAEAKYLRQLICDLDN